MVNFRDKLRRVVARVRETIRPSSSGFTFIEVVMVIVIIGIIAAVATSSLENAVDNSRHQEAQEELERLSDAIVGDPDLISGGVRTDYGYVGDVGALPASLDNLVTNPGGYSTWDGPYVRDNFNENANDFKTDPWNTNYVYTGGLTIQSTGSGSNITRQFANSNGDLLSNTVRGVILDRDGAPPGAESANIAVTVTHPDGAGGLTTTTVTPNSSGSFTISGIPMGNQSIRSVYSTQNDTAETFISVAPRVGGFVSNLRFGSGYWTDTTGGGGGGGGGSSPEILRPMGPGSSTTLLDENCTGNWSCVDEAVADGDGTFVIGAGGSWDNDTYATENSTVGAGTIDSVLVFARCKGSGMRIRVALRTGGTLYESADTWLTNSYIDYLSAYTTNPKTSSPWTWAEIDAMEIGVTIKEAGKCTQVWAEVYFQ